MSELRNALGAKKRKPEDWIGKVYSRLTVRSIVRREGPKNTLVVLCDCSCGKSHECRVTYLGEGTQSCGCLVKEINSLPTSQRPPRKKKYSVSPEQKERIRLAKIEWVKANPGKVAAIAKRCREKNPEKLKAEKQEYYQRNKTKICGKVKMRYASDDRFRIEMLLRGRINVAIRLRGARKSARTMELIGCTIEHLMAHIESQFKPGMTWSNRHLWQIDHSTPLCKFNLLEESEQIAAFHWTNLQPLWAEDNMAKKARLDWTPAESKRATTP